MIDFNYIKTDGDSIKNAAQIRAKLDILYNKLLNKEIENNNTVEIRNAIMIFDPFAPFVDLGAKKSNIEYIKQEYEWYKSMSLSINDYVDKVSIWRSCATKDKDAEVNLNQLIESFTFAINQNKSKVSIDLLKYLSIAQFLDSLNIELNKTNKYYKSP